MHLWSCVCVNIQHRDEIKNQDASQVDRLTCIQIFIQSLVSADKSS